MNERLEQDQDVRDVLRIGLAMEEPSPDLMRRLRVMAAETAPARRRRWQPGLALACTLAAGTAVVALTMTPAKATAKTFASLVAAAQKVRSFQFSIDSTESGQHDLLTIAGVDGRVSMRTSEGTIMQIDADSLRLYNPDEKVVTRFKLGHLVNSKEISNAVKSGLEEGLDKADLKKMLRDYQARYGKESIRISPIRHEANQDVYDVDLQSPKEPERVRMVVDAKTDLPNRILVDARAPGGAWRRETAIEMRFGDKVDPRYLNPSFPPGVKIVDIDIESLVRDATKGLDAVSPVIEKFDPTWKGKKDAVRRHGGEEKD